MPEPTPPRSASRQDTTAATPKSVPAVRRAIAILTLLARQHEPLTLSQIAHAVDILPSSCLHILRELAGAHLVTVDARRKSYRLGYGLVELARGVMDQDPLPAAAQPHLKELAERFGMTVTVTAPVDERHVALVAHAQPDEAISINVKPGGRVPILSGAAGRILAACGKFSKNELHQTFQKVRWEIAPRYEQWLAEVDATQRQGWAEDQGHFTRGITTLAVPIRNADADIVGVLGVGAISAQLNARQRMRVIAALKQTAKAIQARL